MDVALLAYHARLVSDATLVGMLSTFSGAPAVFIGDVPEGASLPYLVISGPVSDTPIDDKDDTSPGRELLIDFRIAMKRSGSTAAISAAAERMRSRLHRSRVTVAGFASVYEEALGPVVDDSEHVYSRILTLRVLLGGA